MFIEKRSFFSLFSFYPSLTSYGFGGCLVDFTWFYDPRISVGCTSVGRAFCTTFSLALSSPTLEVSRHSKGVFCFSLLSLRSFSVQIMACYHANKIYDAVAKSPGGIRGLEGKAKGMDGWTSYLDGDHHDDRNENRSNLHVLSTIDLHFYSALAVAMVAVRGLFYAFRNICLSLLTLEALLRDNSHSGLICTFSHVPS